jgi:CheY-like chemotaxis protein
MILVAEDDADSREMMRVLLESKGYNVSVVADGRQAVSSALRNPPDLLLIDLELPDLNGLQVVRTLRVYPELKDTPMLILSGYDPGLYRQSAIDAGCDDYLLKPLNFDRLYDLLEGIIHSH